MTDREKHEEYVHARMATLEAEAEEHEKNGTMTEELRGQYAASLAWLYDDLVLP